MAPLWGKSDSLFSTGNLSVNLSTRVCTISSGTLPAAETIVGATVTITGKGSAIIESRESNTTFKIIDTRGLDGTAISGVAYNISELPTYTIRDSNYNQDEIFGVSAAEIEETRDDNSPYHPAHAGWVGISSYIDQHGKTRVKTEVLVAGSHITGDADDDTILPDS